jgi:hypothetical protein
MLNFGELFQVVRQVAVNCETRGKVFMDIWKQYLALFNAMEKRTKKDVSTWQKKVAIVC